MWQRGNSAICLGFVVFLFLIFPPQRANAVSVEMGPFELALKPGEVYLGSVTVTNEKPEPVTIRLYLGDWAQTDDGEQYPETGTEPRSLSKWMQVYPTQMTLDPDESEEAYFQVIVPDDPGLSGSYWGIFFVEGEPQPDEDDNPKSEKATIGLNIVVRHGVKVYVTIPDTGEKKAEFVAAWTEQPPEGGLDFIATFENQGNTYLRPKVWLELRDLSGATAYSEEYRTLSILPGIRRDYKFELRELNIPPGRYIALIIADYGATNLIAAQAEIGVRAK